MRLGRRQYYLVRPGQRTGSWARTDPPRSVVPSSPERASYKSLWPGRGAELPAKKQTRYLSSNLFTKKTVLGIFYFNCWIWSKFPCFFRPLNPPESSESKKQRFIFPDKENTSVLYSLYSWFVATFLQQVPGRFFILKNRKPGSVSGTENIKTINLNPQWIYKEKKRNPPATFHLSHGFALDVINLREMVTKLIPVSQIPFEKRNWLEKPWEKHCS